jgi:hypothetical protein
VSGAHCIRWESAEVPDQSVDRRWSHSGRLVGPSPATAALGASGAWRSAGALDVRFDFGCSLGVSVERGTYIVEARQGSVQYGGACRDQSIGGSRHADATFGESP